MTARHALPVDPRNPGDAFLQEEIDRNRSGEWVLLPKAAIALAFVAILVAVREVLFV